MSAVIFESAATGDIGEQSQGLPKMSFITDAKSGSRTVEVPLQPAGYTVDVPTLNWQTIARPGRKPLLEEGGEDLGAVNMTLNVMHVDGDLAGTSIEALLYELRSLSENGPMVSVHNTPQMPSTPNGPSGWWRITRMSITITDYVGGSRLPKRATVTMTLTEESSATIAVGPLSGGIGSGFKPAAVGGSYTLTTPTGGSTGATSAVVRDINASTASGSPTQRLSATRVSAEAYADTLQKQGAIQSEITTGIAALAATIRGFTAADWKAIADNAGITTPWDIPTGTTIPVPRQVAPVPQIQPSVTPTTIPAVPTGTIPR